MQLHCLYTKTVCLIGLCAVLLTIFHCFNLLNDGTMDILLNLTTESEGEFNHRTNQYQIFYNRVGKSGSRTLQDVVRALGEQNNFTVRASELTSNYRLDAVTEPEFVEEFESYHQPLFYNRHLFFVDFTKYGYKQPIYINLVRDPIETRISHFNYIKENNFADSPYDLSNITIEECVLKNHLFCTHPDNVNNLIYYFCGQDKTVCNAENASGSTLKQALRNVEKYYLVIGVLDHFEETLEALELALPNYFKGARHVYQNIKDVLRKSYRTSSMKSLSTEATEVLKTRLESEYQLYDFIRQKFFDTLNNLKKLPAAE